MAEEIVYLTGRKYKRLPIRSPLDYEIGGINLRGVSLNASSAGIMVKSSLSLKTAFEILAILDKEPNYHTELKIVLEEETYVVEAEIKHFHLDFSGSKPYEFRVGFGFSKSEIQVRKNR